MLIEKYMNIEVEVPNLKDEYDSPDIYYEEVYVEDSDIRHYIDTYMSAEDVLNYAKQIAPEEFTGKDAANLDLAYDILIEEYDEHDDIEDLKDLNDYIQECAQQDYKKEAMDSLYDKFENAENDEIENSHYIRANMPR